MTSTDRLDQLAAELAGLATADDRQRLAELTERLAARRLRVLVAGEAKRGKSTLVNRLLGKDVLPTGVIPVTAVATTVLPAGADGEGIRVTHLDGRRERHPLAELSRYVTERENPDNARGVRDVEAFLDSELLARFDLELVDTPGTGSVHAHNTSAAEQVLGTLDAAIFVVTADPPISAAERELLTRITGLSVHTFVALNKADQLAADELRESTEFTEQVCRDVARQDVPIFACAARVGRADAGWRAFADAFTDYLAERGDTDAAAALCSHLSRLAAAMLDAALITERSVQLRASRSADRATLFRERADEIAARRRTIDDQCWAGERRIRRELATAAGEQITSLTAVCRAVAIEALDGELAALPPAEVETRGRDVVVRTIHEHTDQWRSARADAIERELRAQAGQAEHDLDRQLAELRAAAKELLDIDLHASRVAHELQASRRFWYALEPGVGWEPPLADAARRLLPGRARRARDHVLGEIGELVDRQLGRARADLDQRLRESVRRIVAGLHATHEQVLDRVLAALDEAVAISAATAVERDRLRDELTERATRLRALIAELDQNG